jgi:predicted unusual protein kinase regulating ubiquinone biosynthesis (AarF/ABC1/UbiB family)
LNVSQHQWINQNYLFAPAVGYLTAWQWFGTPTTTQLDDLAIVPSADSEVVESRKSLSVVPETNLSTWKQVRRKVRRAFRIVARIIKLMIALAPVAALYPIQRLFQTSQKKRDEKLDAHLLALHDEDTIPVGALGWYLRVCLQCVEWSGAAVIKLMQWAGSRPDLFGHEFCSVFSQLQDNTTPHAWSHTEQVMREAYGDDWKDRIALKKILGSGCIGQVYLGVVKDRNGVDQEVAVKGKRP